MKDLFEAIETLPPAVQMVVEGYSERLEFCEGDSYALCKEFLAAVKQLGYEFDYGLDGIPGDLRELEFPGEDAASTVRLAMTIRQPKSAALDTRPWVILEGEGVSGVAVAMFGPDSPTARADARKMMRLWNGTLSPTQKAQKLT